MRVQRLIEAKIREAFSPDHVELINESFLHSVPPGSESHFRLLVVSDGFEGKSRVQRHQAVYRILAAELEGPVHALGLQTFTRAEWEKEHGPLGSPPCLGGGGTAS
jgi:BolA protein